MAKNYELLPDSVTMYTKTETLKDVQDLSKNLVTGDFEKEFKGTMEDGVRRKRRTCLITAVVFGVIIIALLVLAAVREVEIRKLRHDVDGLTENLIKVSASVESLHQKIKGNKLYNGIKHAEDTLYPVEDQGSIEIDGGKEKDHSLKHLSGLTTVLEDTGDPIDDEDYDGDDEGDEESGDWYPEYDRRREKIGSTNMIKLRPEDFTETELSMPTGNVLTEVNEDHHPPKSLIREIKRLSQGKVDRNEHKKGLDRMATPSTSERPSTETFRERRSLKPDEIVDNFAAPRVVSKFEDGRRKTKKFSPMPEPSRMKLHSVSRIARNSDDEVGSRRPFIAAHFHGNTSHLSPEIHEHYRGNGLVRVSHDKPHDVWYPSPWTVNSPHPRPTLSRNGHVHVHHTGVYLVYVQIYYLDSHDIISWVLHRTNAEIEGRESLLQCAQSSHSAEGLERPNSCFSAAALFLKAGDKLAVRNTGGDRHSLMQPEKSFIGLVKLADAEDPTQEF